MKITLTNDTSYKLSISEQFADDRWSLGMRTIEISNSSGFE